MSDIRFVYYEMSQQYANQSIEFHRKVENRDGAEVFVGITERKLPYLMFECTTAIVAPICTREFSGFAVEKKENSCSDVAVITITSKTVAADSEIFYIIVQDCFDSIERKYEVDVSEVLAERLIAWIKFFRKSTDGVLPYASQVGLFGELLFINQYIDRIGPDVIKAWKGPLSAAKDFVFGNTAVEIKSSVQSDVNRIHISDEYQLDSSGYESLVLNFHLLFDDNLNGRSIPDLVFEIKEKLKKSGDDEVLEFQKLLHEVGFDEKFSGRYSNSFSEVQEYFFGIRDGFPRLYGQHIPAGVSHVNYNIDLANCVPFQIEDGQFWNKFWSVEK